MQSLVYLKSRFTIIVIICLIYPSIVFSQENENDINLNHITISTNPNLFYFWPQHQNNYIGSAIIPELAYSLDFSKKQRFGVYFSVLTNNVTALTTTNSSAAASTPSIYSVSTTPIIGSIGLNINLISEDTKKSPSSSLFHQFYIGVGYGNVYTGTDTNGNSVYQMGFLITTGFRVSALSFNF